MDALKGSHFSEPARERLYAVLRRRLETLEPHRDAIASLARWAARDPLTAAALNREIVNSMRFMREAADIDSDGPVGALKLQGLAFAWKHVVDDWVAGDIHTALGTLDRELAKGERYVERAEDFARWTRPFHDIASRLLDWGAGRRRHGDTDDYPHPHA
ncbi:MAG: TetR/AcrR family transcriptional regulator [Methylocystis sp.]|nr:TetR/AcrR family transcriptional regulator [Methylocystis sp.]